MFKINGYFLFFNENMPPNAKETKCLVWGGYEVVFLTFSHIKPEHWEQENVTDLKNTPVHEVIGWVVFLQNMIICIFLRPQEYIPK